MLKCFKNQGVVTLFTVDLSFWNVEISSNIPSVFWPWWHNTVKAQNVKCQKLRHFVTECPMNLIDSAPLFVIGYSTDDCVKFISSANGLYTANVIREICRKWSSVSCDNEVFLMSWKSSPVVGFISLSDIILIVHGCCFFCQLTFTKIVRWWNLGEFRPSFVVCLTLSVHAIGEPGGIMYLACLSVCVCVHVHALAKEFSGLLSTFNLSCIFLNVCRQPCKQILC